MIESPGLLLLVLAALIAVPFVLRRQRGATPDGVRVVGRTALSKTAVVAVVAVGERRLLVGAGEHGVQLLSELGAATAEVEQTTSDATVRAARTPTPVDRTDAGDPTARPDEEALSALLGAQVPVNTAGPGIGLVDRLRAMTVRTPVGGRPLRVPLRR